MIVCCVYYPKVESAVELLKNDTEILLLTFSKYSYQKKKIRWSMV